MEKHKRTKQKKINSINQSFGIRAEGWNNNDLIDLIEWGDDVAKVMYDIKNCIRGAYCRKIGNNIVSLNNHLLDLCGDLAVIRKDLKANCQ